MRTHNFMLGALLLGGALSVTSAMAEVVPSSEAARTIVVGDLRVNVDSVSGNVVNNSSATIRGVELLLRQVWHWTDDLHPGADSPGRTLPFTLAGDVAPHASAPFTFQFQRLPERSDGRFETTMDVVRFTEVSR